MSAKTTGKNRYSALIEAIFFDHYETGQQEIPFAREDLTAKASELEIPLPKNLGDVIYSFRYRNPLPDAILQTQPEGMEWIILGAGSAKYLFKLVKINRITPNPDLIVTKIPDATPEIINRYSLSDEQALLAKIRYNRLVDIFLGISTYSLQNHLRTTVSSVGQLEIDEIYVGVDRHGCQYVLPVQAKGGSDKLSVVQTSQDILCCNEKFPELICRPISTQFMSDDLIAVFELTTQDNEIKVVDERHYRLVPADEIGSEDLSSYRRRSTT